MKPTIIIAILCISILEVCAMVQGIDGAMFGVAIAAISGLAGYQVKAVKDKVKGGK